MELHRLPGSRPRDGLPRTGRTESKQPGVLQPAVPRGGDRLSAVGLRCLCDVATATSCTADTPWLSPASSSPRRSAYSILFRLLNKWLQKRVVDREFYSVDVEDTMMSREERALHFYQELFC